MGIYVYLSRLIIFPLKALMFWMKKFVTKGKAESFDVRELRISIFGNNKTKTKYWNQLLSSIREKYTINVEEEIMGDYTNNYKIFVNENDANDLATFLEKYA